MPALIFKDSLIFSLPCEGSDCGSVTVFFLFFFFKGANLIAFQIIWLPVVMRLVVCAGVHVCVHVMERWSSENLVPRSFGC